MKSLKISANDHVRSTGERMERSNNHKTADLLFIWSIEWKWSQVLLQQVILAPNHMLHVLISRTTTANISSCLQATTENPTSPTEAHKLKDETAT